MNRIILSLLLGLALLLCAAPAAPAQPDRPRPGPTPHPTLVKITQRSITLRPAARSDAGQPKDVTYDIDPERTKVIILEVTERKSDDGKIIESARARVGRLADLK